MASKHYVVSRVEARKPLVEWLHARLGLPWQEARRLVRAGRVRLDGRPCPDATRRLYRGQQIDIDLPRAPRSPGGRKDGPVVRFVDAHVVVVEKPAGLTTVRHASEAAEFGERGR